MTVDDASMCFLASSHMTNLFFPKLLLFSQASQVRGKKSPEESLPHSCIKPITSGQKLELVEDLIINFQSFIKKF